MLLQRGHGGNQGTHASRNAHRCCQDVIHHQRGCGQQSGPYAKVFTGDRVRSATLRIRHDGLAVGEVYDCEEEDDTDTNGDYVSHPGHSKRNQERQGSFRPIGGGAERIQAENGNPFGGSYSFSLLFLGRKRSAQQQIDKIHGSILPQPCVQRWRQTGTQSELSNPDGPPALHSLMALAPTMETLYDVADLAYTTEGVTGSVPAR